MGKSAYPVEGDGFQFLVSAGLRATGGQTETESFLHLPEAMLAGRQQFEKEAGRVMLAVTGTRTFDPPKNYGAVMRFGADMAGNPSALSVDGSAKVLNTDYYLGPQNADADNKPFEWVEFANPYLAGLQKRRSVSITALWGWGATIPEDAWLAMIKLGISEVGAALGNALSGGLMSWKDADVAEQYGADPLAGFLDRCQGEGLSAAGWYVKATSWL